MLSPLIKRITGFIGLALVATFVLGLAHSISTGFAGLAGGLPFVIIVFSVLAMVIYDFWDQCIKKH
jgi:hypothetical protein